MTTVSCELCHRHSDQFSLLFLPRIDIYGVKDFHVDFDLFSLVRASFDLLASNPPHGSQPRLGVGKFHHSFRILLLVI